jgi:hypothetical protein
MISVTAWAGAVKVNTAAAAAQDAHFDARLGTHLEISFTIKTFYFCNKKFYFPAASVEARSLPAVTS